MKTLKRIMVIVMSFVVAVTLFQPLTVTAETDGEAGQNSEYFTDGILKDGTYSIEAETDSSMFAATKTTLVAEKGKMYAIMSLKGQNFIKIYMGGADEAKVAEESGNEEAIIGSMLGYTDNTANIRTFWPIPVSALDKKISISGKSRKKNKGWYAHDIVFKSNTLKLIDSKPVHTTDEKNAMKRIYSKYVDGNIFESPDAAISKSLSGDNYTIPYTKADGSGPITQVKFAREKSSDYIGAWHISEEDNAKAFSNKKKDLKPTSSKARKIKRGSEDINITAKLRIYDKNSTANWDDEKSPYLAELPFNITIKAAPADIKVSFLIKDKKTGKQIDNAAVKLVDAANNEVKPGEDKVFTLKGSEKYSLEVSAPDYVDLNGNEVFKTTYYPGKDETCEIELLAKKDSNHKVKFNILDLDKKEIKNPKLEVAKQGGGEKVKPDEDGRYTLFDGKAYYYSVEADGYISHKDIQLSVTEDKNIEVLMKPVLKEYKVKFNVESNKSYDKIDQPYTIKVTCNKDGKQEELKTNTDNSYTLKRDVEYTVTVNSDGYDECVETFIENGDEGEIEKRILLIRNNRGLLKDSIESANNLKRDVKEGTEPGNFPVGTIKTLDDAISKANVVFLNEKSKDEDLDREKDALEKVLKSVRRAQLPEEATVKIRVNRAAGAAPEIFEIHASATLAARYKYDKPASYRKKVTPLDAAIALHLELYGDDFAKDPKRYLQYDEFMGSPGLIFASPSASSYSGFKHNDFNNVHFSKFRLVDGDTLSMYVYDIKHARHTEYLYFEKNQFDTETGKTVRANLYGSDALWAPNNEHHPEEGFTVELEEQETKAVVTAKGKSDDKGNVEFSFEKPGIYLIKSVAKDGIEAVILPYIKVAVKEKPKSLVQHTKPLEMQLKGFDGYELEIFDIYFTAGTDMEEHIIPEEMMDVKVDLKKIGTDNLQIFHQKPDGQLEEIKEFRLTGKTVLFKSKDFSPYIFANKKVVAGNQNKASKENSSKETKVSAAKNEKETPSTGDNSNIPINVTVIAAAVIIGAVAKRKSQK